MQKDPSSYALLFTLPDSVLQPERVLWLHVIAQALIDAASRDKEIRQEIIDWIDTEDFEVVCGMAGMQPSYVRHAANAILAEKNQRKAFKKAMNFRFLVRSYVDSHMGEIDKRKDLKNQSGP